MLLFFAGCATPTPYTTTSPTGPVHVQTYPLPAAGRAWVLTADQAVQGVELANAYMTLTGLYAGDSIGLPMANFGDADQDGVTDLWVQGSGRFGDQYGRGYLVPALPGAVQLQDDLGGLLGCRMGSCWLLDDLDGDGAREVVALDDDGLGLHWGAALPSFPSIAEPASVLDLGGLGVFSASLPGDLDLDGVPDVVLVGEDESFLFGGVQWIEPNIDLGDAVQVHNMRLTHWADVDGDAVQDGIEVTQENGAHTGHVKVWSGTRAWGAPLTGDDHDAIVDDPSFSHLWGSLPTVAGDIDGDGRDDLAITAPYDPLGSRVWFVLGSSLAGTVEEPDAELTWDIAANHIYAQAANLDGDSLDDLILRTRDASGEFRLAAVLGASLDMNGTTEVSTVAVGTWTIPIYAEVFILGDIDGDGLDDVGFGAPYAVTEVPHRSR